MIILKILIFTVQFFVTANAVSNCIYYFHTIKIFDNYLKKILGVSFEIFKKYEDDLIKSKELLKVFKKMVSFKIFKNITILVIISLIIYYLTPNILLSALITGTILGIIMSKELDKQSTVVSDLYVDIPVLASEDEELKKYFS